MGNSDRKRVDQNVAKIIGFSDFPIDMLRILLQRMTLQK